MANNETQKLDERHYIRHKLYAGKKSSFQRYAELVVGEVSFWKLLRYELVTMLFGLLPGALGLLLRKIFYPSLFKRVGKGTVFGRNIVIRNADRISLGRDVIIDDDCLIDGRGAGEQGIVIGDQVVINRGVSIQSKIGPLSIGSHSDIGAHSTIISQGGTDIGEMVTLGGGCKIGGGSLQLQATTGDKVSEEAARNDFLARGQGRFTRGTIRVESRCAFGGGAMVMDGVRVGSGSVIAAGAILREDVPTNSVVMAHQKLMVVPRSQFGGTETPAVEPVRHTQRGEHSVAPEKVLDAIYRALDELNEQLPMEAWLKKSPETLLVEPGGPLDSVGLVNLIVITEQIIAEELGRTIDLAPPQSEFEDKTPFATVSAFADYIGRVLMD